MARRRSALTVARGERGLTVKQLAARLGISSSFLYKIEGGVRDPSIPLMAAMSRELEKGVEVLFFASETDTVSGAVAGR